MVVLRDGATSELSSGFGLEESRIIADAPGVRSGADGPLASAELFVIVDVPKRSTGTDVNVPMRGVQPSAFAVSKEFAIVEGRNFEPGRNEVIVGDAAAREFAGLEVGSVRRWGENEWKVVGHFSDRRHGRGLRDLGRRQSAPAGLPARQLVPVGASAARLGGRASPRSRTRSPPTRGCSVDVIRESEYYAEQSQLMISIIRGLGYAIALLMGVGAVFGALNTMYMAVSGRTREIATLRALGFGASPVVVSVLAESLLLAGLGAVVGVGHRLWLFNGYQAATMNFQTFSQVAFAFAVTPELLTQGAVFALVMGSLGGFFPALRAARQPVATALRQI